MCKHCCLCLDISDAELRRSLTCIQLLMACYAQEGEMSVGEVHLLYYFVLEAQVVEPRGAVPVVQLSKQRFNSVFKPGAASSGPYSAEFLETLQKSLLLSRKSPCHAASFIFPAKLSGS